jgi:hypothetical protein
MEVQFLMQMGHFIFEDTNKDEENSSKEARLLDLIEV